jgi:hypothetical protein
MGGRASILLLLVLSLLAIAPANAFAQWAIQYVDVGGGRGGPTSLGLDMTGAQAYPVLSYFGAPGHLKYAAMSQVSKIWGLTRVDAGGEFNSLDVDAAGVVHVAYLDSDTQELKYWRLNQGQSSIQLVDTEAGQFNSIRVGGGSIHISYWRANGTGIATPDRLMIADYNGTAWSPSFADPTPPRGRYNSLVLDQLGNPGIAYYDADPTDFLSRRLRIAVRLSDLTWQYQVVDSIGDPGRFNSIQINAGALPRISYLAGITGGLRFASLGGGGGWTLQDVASVGTVENSSVTSLALDASGNPRIAYYDALSDSVKYASRSGASTWTIVGVDHVGSGGGYVSLRLDTANRPIISYYDATTQTVKIAYGAGFPDTDGDGIPDTYDAFPAVSDQNNNGILDGKEGGVLLGSGTGTSRLEDEPIFGCGSLAALYGSRPRGGGSPPPPADLLILLTPAIYLLYRRRFPSRARA